MSQLRIDELMRRRAEIRPLLMSKFPYPPQNENSSVEGAAIRKRWKELTAQMDSAKRVYPNKSIFVYSEGSLSHAEHALKTLEDAVNSTPPDAPDWETRLEKFRRGRG